MMTCHDAVAYVLDWLDGALPPELGAALHEHVDKCPRCQRFVSSYRKTIALCQRVGRVEAPKGLLEQVLAKLQERLHIKSDSR